MLKANSEKMLLRKIHKKFEQCKKSEKIKMLPEIHKVVSHLSDKQGAAEAAILKVLQKTLLNVDKVFLFAFYLFITSQKDTNHCVKCEILIRKGTWRV